MNRLLAILLGLSLLPQLGCLEDLEPDCASDSDCPEGLRCVDRGVKVCVDPAGGGGGTAGTGGDGGGAGGGGEGGSGGTDGNGGTGGSGGTDGNGGEGGTGGAGSGDGGAGGSGGVVIPSAIVVEIRVDAELATYLEEHSRVVGALILRMDGEHAPAESTFRSEDVGPLLIAPFGAHRFELPSTLPIGEEEEVEMRVEALALLLDESTDVIATASLTATIVGDPEPGPIVLTLSYEPSFDFDGDGAPDLGDCEPDEPSIRPGPIDVCDGVDRSCTPGICRLPLPGGSSGVRDVSCEGGSCIAAVGGMGDAGSLLFFDGDLDSPVPWASLPVTDPKRVAFVPTTSKAVFHQGVGQRVNLVVDTATPTSGNYFAAPTDVAGSLAVSPHGNLGFIGFQSLPGLMFFSPSSATIEERNLGCDGDHVDCHLIDLSNLGPTGDKLQANAYPRHIAVRQKNKGFQSQAYVVFENETRLGIAVIHATTKDIIPASSGLLRPLQSAHPRALTLDPPGDRLYIAGGETTGQGEASMIVTNAIAADHSAPTPFALPAGTCPAALRIVDDHLYVADDCQGSVWELPLGAGGLPDADSAIRHTLPDCASPFALGTVAKTASIDRAVLVACRDAADRILVIGRD